jgi:diguanylate cyclase (GGDEF)-like protein
VVARAAVTQVAYTLALALSGSPPRHWVVALAVVSTFAAGVFAAQMIASARRRASAGDPQEALALVGTALESTHDMQALLPAILKIAVEGTGAAGGRITIDDADAASVGSAPSEESLVLPLSTAPTRADLILYPESGGFAPAARALASSLAAQASVALENARRHRLVERQAATDELTGLPNRRLFMRSLAAEFARAKRTGGVFSVVLLDLDDFKRVNDRFGHDAGDRALREFADVLRSAMRETDVAARLGGEEFGCLLPSSDAAGAYGLAERIRSDLARRVITLPDGREVSITASLGVADYPAAKTSEALLRAADLALYRAKADGKNRVVSTESAA